MKKVLIGMITFVMAIIMAIGSCFIVQNYNAKDNQDEDSSYSDYLDDSRYVVCEVENSEDDVVQANATSYWSGYRSSRILYDNVNSAISIESAAELALFAYAVNNGKPVTCNGKTIYLENAKVILNNDIDLSAHYWVPIGNKGKSFKGEFDGQGHTISGINIVAHRGELSDLFGTFSSGMTYNAKWWNTWVSILTNPILGFLSGLQNCEKRAIGLFGLIEGAYLHDFNVKGEIGLYGDNWDVTFDAQDSQIYVGGAVGYAQDSKDTANSYSYYSIIKNVNNVGLNIKMTRTGRGIVSSNWATLGGIVGAMIQSSDMLNCVNYSGKVSSSVSTGADTISEITYILGGIAGLADGDRLHGCVCYANVAFSHPNTTSQWFTGAEDRLRSLIMGGIVGYSMKTSDSNYILDIRNCSFHGKLTTTGLFHFVNGIGSIGGILGRNETEGMIVSDCFNYGFMSVRDAHDTYVGGIVGSSITANITVESCGNISHIYIYNTRSDETEKSYGGIVGYIGSEKNGRIQDCVNYGNITFTATETIKFCGGILGRGMNNIYINRCINYGNISAANSHCFGGIAGELGKAKETFLFVTTEEEWNTVYVYNCVNFGKVSASSSVGSIVGYLYGSNVSKCYATTGVTAVGNKTISITTGLAARTILNIEGDYSFFRSKYNWTNGSVNGVEMKGFYDGSGHEVTTEYNTGKDWIISTHIADRFTSVNVAGLKYSLLPMSALASANVQVRWLDENGEESTTNLGEIFTFSTKTYNTNLSVVWSEVDAETYGNSFTFLRNVSYYNSTYARALFKVNLKTAYQAKFLFNKMTLTEQQETYGGYKNSLAYGSSSSGGWCAEFQLVQQLSPYYSIYSSDMTFKFVFDSQGEDLNIDYYMYTPKGIVEGSGIETKISEPHVVGRFKASNSSGQSKAHYNSLMTYQVTPKLGYAFYDIIDDKKEVVISNHESAITDVYGPVSRQKTYDYQSRLRIRFTPIEYTMKTYYGSNSSGSSKFQYKTVNEQDESLTSNGITISNSSWYITYGYEYSIYLCKYTSSYSSGYKSNGVLIKTGEPNDNWTLSISADEFASAMSNLASKYGEDETTYSDFSIYIDRTPIEYTVNIHSMVNTYNNLYSYREITAYNYKSLLGLEGYNVEFGTEFAHFGSGVTTITTNVESSFYLDYTNSKTFKYGSSGVLSFSASNYNNYNIDYFNQNGTNYFLFWLSSYNSKVGSSIRKRTFDVYARYGLQDYNFYGQMQINCEDVSNNSFSIAVTSGEKGTSTSSDTEKNFSACQIVWYAPVTLKLNSLPLGKKFTGWFIKNKNGNLDFLSNEYSYQFVNNPLVLGNASKNTIYIYAKFETYSTVEKGYVAQNERDVYEISTADDLIWLSQKVEGGESFDGKIFNQTAHIDMVGYKFNPIGSQNNPFKGVYNGCGYTISNLTLYGTDDTSKWVDSNKGLFGYVKDATIKNLTLIDGEIAGFENVGAVVGYAENSTLKYLNNKSCKVSSKSVGQYNVYEVLINTLQSNNFGGVVGYTKNCTLYACSNRMEVSCSGENCSGLVGFAESSTIYECFYENSAKLDLAKYDSDIRIRDCYCRYSNNNITYITPTYMENGKFDSSIWITVNSQTTLRAFYWS